MYFIELFSVLSLISISSSLLLPDKLSVLLCKDNCKYFSGCTSVRFDSKHLQCELIFGTEKTGDTEERGIRLFKVQAETSTKDCGQKEKVVYNRLGSPKCMKAPKTICKKVTKKEGACRGAPTVQAQDEGSRCILHRRENVTVKEKGQLVQLPLTLEPGMKLIVHAATPREASSSEFTFTMDAVHPKNMMKWFHTIIRWSERKVHFYQGFVSSKGSFGGKGKFPISDKANFTLTLELSELKTKIYANKIPMKTMGLVSGMVEFSVHKFSHIHAVVIQKTGEECEKVSTGIP